MCPSGAAFAIPLGPTNPWLIYIAKETLIFRRAGFSPALRLLVPTFLLPSAPVWVTPSPSVRMEYSPTNGQYRSIVQSSVSVRHLSPDYLRREISRWVSCYAIFEWWLLLSLHPHCKRNFTTLSALNVDLGTLNRDLGLFPFWPMELSPHSLTAG